MGLCSSFHSSDSYKTLFQVTGEWVGAARSKKENAYLKQFLPSDSVVQVAINIVLDSCLTYSVHFDTTLG